MQEPMAEPPPRPMVESSLRPTESLLRPMIESPPRPAESLLRPMVESPPRPTESLLRPTIEPTQPPTKLSYLPYKVAIHPGPIHVNINVMVDNSFYMEYENTSQLTIKYYPGMDACIIQNLDHRVPLSQLRTYALGVFKFATRLFPATRHMEVRMTG